MSFLATIPASHFLQSPGRQAESTLCHARHTPDCSALSPCLIQISIEKRHGGAEPFNALGEISTGHHESNFRLQRTEKRSMPRCTEEIRTIQDATHKGASWLCWQDHGGYVLDLPQDALRVFLLRASNS